MSVTQIFPEGGNLGLVLPSDLCKWTTDKVRKVGVAVHPGTLISKAGVEEGKVKVTLSNGEEVSIWNIISREPLEIGHKCLCVHVMYVSNNVRRTISLYFTTHTQLTADHVVVAVGLQPNTELSKSAKLETDPQFGGYRVNSELQACSDIWAVSFTTVY